MASRSNASKTASTAKPANGRETRAGAKPQDGRGKMLDPQTDGRRNRGPREFTSDQRAQFMAAKGADTEATGNQKTNYQLLKDIWSGRGEIVANVKGIPVEVKRSDLIRQLEALPREGKAVLKVVEGEGDLKGLRVLM
jgi:hypothetical protein